MKLVKRIYRETNYQCNVHVMDSLCTVNISDSDNYLSLVESKTSTRDKN